MLLAVQPVTLALHNLCKSEDELLTGMLKARQLGLTPKDIQVLARAGRGMARGHSPRCRSHFWWGGKNEDPV